MNGAEAGRGGEDHQIDVVQIQHLLICIEADESSLFGHVDLVTVPGDIPLVQAATFAAIDALAESVGDSYQLHVVRSAQCLTDGLAASTASTNEPNANGVVSKGMRGTDYLAGAQGNASGG